MPSSPDRSTVTRIAVNTCLSRIQSEKIRPELRWADLSEEQQQVMGSDPWVYGLGPNRKNLEAMHRYGQLCGLVTKPLKDVADWFYPSTLDETPDLLH